MCGIVGIYYFDKSRHVEESQLKKMNDAIIHRGPDDEGYFLQDYIGIGMRRLSVIDLEGGHQPISTPDGSRTIVFNGEVYNFIDKRPELLKDGYNFSTESDTEVVLALYTKYGMDFLQHLNGMYGLCIWDQIETKMILARDRLGIKPLYYYKDEERIIFASEIKSILTLAEVTADLETDNLPLYLEHGFTPAPYTLFRNIYKLPPGHTMVVRGNDIKIHEYWDVSYQNKLEISEKQIEEELYELLKSSVKYQMISDVPLGAFLSAGIDSSGIVHLMSELGSEKINTYTIGFGEGYGAVNESLAAAKFAHDYNTNHHEIIVKPDVADLFPKLMAGLDEPLGDSSFIVTYLVSKLARETVTVILSGVGGDELFAGYRRYLNVKLNKLANKIPLWIRMQVINKFLGQVSIDRNNTLLNYFRLAKAFFETAELSIVDQYASYTTVLNRDLRDEILCSSPGNASSMLNYFEKCDSAEVLDKLLYADLKTSLPDQLLMLTDKMSMAASIEGRFPYLDHRVVEYAARIPLDLKIKGINLRHVQKQIFKNRFPPYVIKQKKKGFGAPIGTWIRKELRESVYDLLGHSHIKRQGIFNESTMNQLLDDHFNLRADHSDQILGLLSFQLWHEAYIK